MVSVHANKIQSSVLVDWSKYRNYEADPKAGDQKPNLAFGRRCAEHVIQFSSLNGSLNCSWISDT